MGLAGESVELAAESVGLAGESVGLAGESVRLAGVAAEDGNEGDTEPGAASKRPHGAFQFEE